MNSGIVVGALAFHENVYDGDTLEAQMQQIDRLLDKLPERTIGDRGYKGVKTCLEYR
jgi:IS5 family transposase